MVFSLLEATYPLFLFGGNLVKSLPSTFSKAKGGKGSKEMMMATRTLMKLFK